MEPIQGWDELMWMGSIFIKYNTLPFQGGSLDQPHLFWIVVEKINEIRLEEEQRKGGKRPHKLYDVELQG